MCWSAEIIGTVSLSSLSHPKTEGETCTALSPQTDVLSVSFTIFNHHFLWTKRKETKTINNKSSQHRKQHSICIIQETQWEEKMKKQGKKSKYRILTCHIVPWASFLSQKATYFTSFCSNKNNRHLKWLPAG